MASAAATVTDHVLNHEANLYKELDMLERDIAVIEDDYLATYTGGNVIEGYTDTARRRGNDRVFSGAPCAH